MGVWGKRLLGITKVDWNHLLKGGCMVRVQKIYFAKKIFIWLNRLDQVISIKYYLMHFFNCVIHLFHYDNRSNITQVHNEDRKKHP